ncbi:hypothetical protein NE237_012303 [Protea cynaroides]|uniref:Uncharacterized protein n=1 Tax=Protea cynaroides TaxID=273540 RepID=A0A9Q0JYQ0_9MAGN|nr:hypothetical protein NE237_012303 [Protea cynaroides]
MQNHYGEGQAASHHGSSSALASCDVLLGRGFLPPFPFFQGDGFWILEEGKEKGVIVLEEEESFFFGMRSAAAAAILSLKMEFNRTMKNVTRSEISKLETCEALVLLFEREN